MGVGWLRMEVFINLEKYIYVGIAANLKGNLWSSRRIHDGSSTPPIKGILLQIIHCHSSSPPCIQMLIILTENIFCQEMTQLCVSMVLNSEAMSFISILQGVPAAAKCQLSFPISFTVVILAACYWIFIHSSKFPQSESITSRLKIYIRDLQFLCSLYIEIEQSAL